MTPRGPYQKKYHRARRARFIAQGLTCLGKKRKNQRRPELAHLKGNDYFREYLRLYRRGTL
jgi:hypothetical protein